MLLIWWTCLNLEPTLLHKASNSWGALFLKTVNFKVISKFRGGTSQCLVLKPENSGGAQAPEAPLLSRRCLLGMCLARALCVSYRNLDILLSYLTTWPTLSWTSRFFSNLQFWPLVFLHSIDLLERSDSYLLDKGAQGCGMIFSCRIKSGQL